MYNLEEYKWSNQDIIVLGVTIAHEDLVSKNYDIILEKVKKTLGVWYNRGLSLIGKVLVVNTLVASLFVHKMMVLPIIPEHYVKKINNLIREYIWSNKKSKIAYGILQNKKEEGGLGLVNIKNKDKALKATWPQILSKEKEYAKIVYKQLRVSTLGDDIWRCSLKVEDVQRLKISNSFWKDVLLSWSEFNYYKDVRLENQYIWYNSRIRIKDTPIMWGDALNRGLKFVYQLFSKQKYKTHEEIFQEFGLSIMRYNSLKAAIPVDIKEFFLTTPMSVFTPSPPHTYDYCVIQGAKGFAKRVYDFLGDDILLAHNKYLKWRSELGQDFCERILDFGKKHMDIYKVTNITKYRSFQYRLLQRGLITNVQLFKWGITTSNNCTVCKENRETMLHLFVECHQVKDLWRNVFKFVEDYFNVYIDLDRIEPKDIVLNTVYSKPSHIGNFICLLTKQFIYKQRCLKGTLYFPILKSMILLTQNIEKYIAIKNDRMQKHVAKWMPEKFAFTTQENIEDYINKYLCGGSKV